MISLTHCGLVYRTKLMQEPQADRFARCLRANPLFGEVTVETSAKAKSDRRFFVAFVPTSAERVDVMRAAVQDARTERALAEGSEYLWFRDSYAGRPFLWLLSASGEVYEVSACGRTCGCPDFHYRCREQGLKCKHLVALENGLGAIMDIPAPVGASRRTDFPDD